jgi:peroxiredoxin
MNHLQKALVAAALLVVGSALAANMPATPGPAPGAKFSHALAATDQNGKAQTLKSLMGTKGLAVFFVRSADWCPFCKRQLADANQHLAEFRALGVTVVSISVDEVPLVAAFSQSQSIGYTMLSDPKGEINLALGIRDEQYPLGSKAFGVPRPMVFVIDKSGTVRLRYMEPTYRTRPDLLAVLADIAKLKL